MQQFQSLGTLWDLKDEIYTFHEQFMIINERTISTGSLQDLLIKAIKV